MTAVPRERAPAWDEIETVVLDMDGTLLDLHFDDQVWNHALPRRYAEREGLDLGAATAAVRARLGAERGALRWYCLDHWSREFRLDLAAIEGDLADLIEIRPGAVEFLGQLADRGHRTILATNAHPRSLARKLKKTGIGAYFHAVVCAHELGAPKEHEQFWRACAARLALDPATAVLIDDNHEVLRTARRFGFRELYGVRMPNSRGPEVASPEFDCIDSFAAIAPPARGERAG